ncbi:MAG: histidinol-phosphatase [Eubacteriales bacterium]|nr:histidinol-phosphatase [Eubacteriales bacterium]
MNMKKNYHTHTYRCKHASGTDEEYVLAAINAGLDVIGFSDHSPYPMPNGYVTWYRQSEKEAEDYMNSLLYLREKYRSKIKILIGYEAEYYPSYFESLLRLYRTYPLDYVILGQHNIGEELLGCTDSFSPTDDIEVLKHYVSQVCEGLRTGVFTYLAHPDCIKFTGDENVYLREMAPICETAKELNIPLELNLLGLSQNRIYPRESFWSMVGEYGNEVIMGSDAHSPDRVCVKEEYEKAFERFVIPNSLIIIDSPVLLSPFKNKLNKKQK